MLALCRQQTEALVAALEDEHRRQRVEFARLYDGAAASEEAEETSVSGAAASGAQTGSAEALERGTARGDSSAASGGGESEIGEEAGPAVTALDAERGDAEAAGASVAAAGSGYKRARVADIVKMFGGRAVRPGSSGDAGADVAAGGAGASGPSGSAHSAAAGAMEGVEEQGGDERPTAESLLPQDAVVADADEEDATNEGEAEQELLADAVPIVHAQTAAVAEEAVSEDGRSTARSRRSARRSRDQRDPLPQPPPSGSRREGPARLSEHAAVPTQADLKGEQSEAALREHELWFSALGEIVEQVAENGPKSGASRAAYIMHMGVAEDVPQRAGRSLRGRVALITLDGTVMAEGIGQARLEENAFREAYTALVVQVVRIIADRIDSAMQSAGFDPGARRAVADHVSLQETLVERMACEMSTEARWIVLRSGQI